LINSRISTYVGLLKSDSTIPVSNIDILLIRPSEKLNSL